MAIVLAFLAELCNVDPAKVRERTGRFQKSIALPVRATRKEEKENHASTAETEGAAQREGEREREGEMGRRRRRTNCRDLGSWRRREDTLH